MLARAVLFLRFSPGESQFFRVVVGVEFRARFPLSAVGRVGAVGASCRLGVVPEEGGGEACFQFSTH